MMAPSLAGSDLTDKDRRRLRWTRRDSIRKAGARQASRDGSWERVGFARTCTCGLAAGDVGVAWSTAGDVAYPATGVVTCGSVWACPVCSAKVRRARTADVEHVAAAHTDGCSCKGDEYDRSCRAGHLVMVTLTLRHTAKDRLATLVGGLSDAWRNVQRRDEWREIRRDFLTGSIRALEVTHGFLDDRFRNGWHPHLHVILLTSAGVDPHIFASYVRSLLDDEWREAVCDELGDRFAPLEACGVDVRHIEAGSARYVTKISQEVTRADLKGFTRSVWSLIDAGRFGRFNEYATAMKGRRAVQFSRGLRALYGLSAERTDDEIAASLELDLDDGIVVLVVERRRWNRYMRDGVTLAFLDDVAARCRSVRSLGPPLSA